MAIVAFVGKTPMALLPKGIKDLHVVCWPLAGGTHPGGIRQLISAGVKVSFCNDMHVKLFYCEGNGFIVGSANLSANALNGGQHELCVYIDDVNFDINVVLGQISPILPVTADELAKLDIEHDLYNRRNPLANKHNSERCPTFEEAMQSCFPKKWKIATFSDDLPQKDIDELQEDLKYTFGSPRLNNYHGIEDKHFKMGDFVLQVEVNEENGKAVKKPAWLFIDYIAKTSSTSVAVEIGSTLESTRPFAINNAFAAAFKQAFNAENRPSMTDSNGHVTSEFIALIYYKYQHDE